jgi:hypothetical protein
MQDAGCVIRKATPADARLLATLVDLAGEGIPSFRDAGTAGTGC